MYDTFSPRLSTLVGIAGLRWSYVTVFDPSEVHEPNLESLKYHLSELLPEGWARYRVGDPDHVRVALRGLCSLRCVPLCARRAHEVVGFQIQNPLAVAADPIAILIFAQIIY
jgi:hypothetical protein